MALIYLCACFLCKVSRFTHCECHPLWVVTHSGICLCHLLVNYNVGAAQQLLVQEAVGQIQDNEVNFFPLFSVCVWGKSFTQGQVDKL